MPFLDLAGTPAVRFPDPRIKRVNPDGTQRYTAYQALLVWYDGHNGYYSTVIPQTGVQAKIPYFQMLLFGADYIAKIASSEEYGSGSYYIADGTPIVLPTVEYTAPGFASDYAPAVLPAFNPAVYLAQPALRPAYQQIVTGATATNGVTVSGFMAIAGGSDRGLYFQTGVDPDTYEIAPIDRVSVDVLFNAPVIDGPVAFVSGTYVPIADEILPSYPSLPVILWEGDFTQQMKDDGYIIPNADLSGLTANLNVVGLWGRSGYTPISP
jgi:hypothetical protein